MITERDPFAPLKAIAKDAWASFAPMEIHTMIPAQNLVRFAAVEKKQRVLDVACGTGVVALAAARRGAHVCGFDLAPALVSRAQEHARVAGLDASFIEADVENLPYDNESFDVVLSQYGHIFAPRPEVALSEMLRVLKPGGTIAFSTWPPEHLAGRMFALIARYFPAPEGVSPPIQWGEVSIVRERMGSNVDHLTFDRGTMTVPILSIPHYLALLEQTIAPLVKMIEAGDVDIITRVRAELTKIVEDYYDDGVVRSHYLMTKGRKRAG